MFNSKQKNKKGKKMSSLLTSVTFLPTQSSRRKPFDTNCLMQRHENHFNYSKNSTYCSIQLQVIGGWHVKTRSVPIFAQKLQDLINREHLSATHYSPYSSTIFLMHYFANLILKIPWSYDTQNKGSLSPKVTLQLFLQEFMYVNKAI